MHVLLVEDDALVASGIAAHELRTPLTAVQTHIQVARLANGGTGTALALLHAEQGVLRLQSTIEQLLMLARRRRPGLRPEEAIGARDVAARPGTTESISGCSWFTCLCPRSGRHRKKPGTCVNIIYNYISKSGKQRDVCADFLLDWRQAHSIIFTEKS